MAVATETREQQSVSLLPRHQRALKWLARQNGDDRKSPVIRELIEREMRARLGLEWDAELLRLEDEAA